MALALLAAAPLAKGAEQAVKPDEAVNRLLEPIREKHKLAGLVGGIVHGDKLVAAGAVGVRKAGSPEPLTVNDQMHLGSCTKAMTATLLARLVEAKKLSWQTTVGEVFPDLKETIHPDCRKVTLAQLLSHRAGVPANTNWWSFGANKPTPEQRLNLVKSVLKGPPKSNPGEKYVYSNVGYAIAAAMAEKVTGKSWEELIRQKLFKPLGMTSAGFGVPGTKDQVDQPWGHVIEKEKQKPIRFDNAPVLGPAGTVHCSVPDWGKFAALHLRGAQGKGKLLKPATFTALHTPPEKGEYAFGWVVVERDWAGGRALTHGGTNTMWYARLWIAPKRDFALLVVSNQGGDAGAKGTDEAVRALIGHFEKTFAVEKPAAGK